MSNTEPDIRDTEKKRSRRDLQNIINAVLVSPIRAGDVMEADGDVDFAAVKKSNTTVLTRIVMELAYGAMKGDEKKAKILFDYAGLAPVKEKQISVDLPQFVDDMDVRIVASDDDDDEDD